MYPSVLSKDAEFLDNFLLKVDHFTMQIRAAIGSIFGAIQQSANTVISGWCGWRIDSHRKTVDLFAVL